MNVEIKNFSARSIFGSNWIDKVAIPAEIIFHQSEKNGLVPYDMQVAGFKSCEDPGKKVLIKVMNGTPSYNGYASISTGNEKNVYIIDKPGAGQAYVSITSSAENHETEPELVEAEVIPNAPEEGYCRPSVTSISFKPNNLFFGLVAGMLVGFTISKIKQYSS